MLIFYNAISNYSVVCKWAVSYKVIKKFLEFFARFEQEWTVLFLRCKSYGSITVSSLDFSNLSEHLMF